jgi:hypothetical protein
MDDSDSPDSAQPLANGAAKQWTSPRSYIGENGRQVQLCSAIPGKSLADYGGALTEYEPCPLDEFTLGYRCPECGKPTGRLKLPGPDVSCLHGCPQNAIKTFIAVPHHFGRVSPTAEPKDPAATPEATATPAPVNLQEFEMPPEPEYVKSDAAIADDEAGRPGTLEWAEQIINRHEPEISGPGADITKAHEASYIEAAAVFSIEDGARYQRLKEVLKNHGLRGASMEDWQRRVREREHQIKAERKAREKAAASSKAKGQPPASSAAPTWSPLASTCQQPVDGYILLLDLRNAIQKFIRLTEDQAIVLALWVLFTWVFERCAEYNPFIRIISSDPNCGKSTLLRILNLLEPHSIR